VYSVVKKLAIERAYFVAIPILSLSFIVGCRSSNNATETIVEDESEVIVSLADTNEVELVEDVVVAGQIYQKSLEKLIEYYAEIGNDLKLQWVRYELRKLQKPWPGPMHSIYPGLRAVVEADALFFEAQALEPPSGKTLPRRGYKGRLRLQKYEQLIKDYPTSDKIDDAAFYAGLVLEEFGDYMVALDYFRSAFKWDSETPYPVRFKAAYILDKQLHRYDEALELYKEALKIEASYGKYPKWREFAEERIKQIQELDDN
jgi:tetratricopeptide (TPR) repeat protein